MHTQFLSRKCDFCGGRRSLKEYGMLQGATTLAPTLRLRIRPSLSSVDSRNRRYCPPFDGCYIWFQNFLMYVFSTPSSYVSSPTISDHRGLWVEVQVRFWHAQERCASSEVWRPSAPVTRASPEPQSKVMETVDAARSHVARRFACANTP